MFTSLVTIVHLCKPGVSSESDKTKKKASLTVCILTVVCLVFTLPAIIKTMLILAGYRAHEAVMRAVVVNSLLYLNSLANPFVYLFRMVNIRRRFGRFVNFGDADHRNGRYNLSSVKMSSSVFSVGRVVTVTK